MGGKGRLGQLLARPGSSVLIPHQDCPDEESDNDGDFTLTRGRNQDLRLGTID